jgi:predicted ATPase
VRKFFVFAVVILFSAHAFSAKKEIADYLSVRVRPEEQGKINRYIITGGPGVGKTTIANYMKTIQDCAAVDEAATAIIKKDLAAGIEKPWEHPGFDERIITMQHADRSIAKKFSADHIFFDRSPIDTIGYCIYHGLIPTQTIITLAESAIHEYNHKVFLVENFGDCEQTAVRPESIDEALLIEKIMERNYTSLGFQIVRVKPGPIESRAAAILKSL